jgi:hypothetical protein
MTQLEKNAQRSMKISEMVKISRNTQQMAQKTKKQTIIPKLRDLIPQQSIPLMQLLPPLKIQFHKLQFSNQYKSNPNQSLQFNNNQLNNQLLNNKQQGNLTAQTCYVQIS